MKDWIIPIGSVLLSVWFAASAKKDSERAQQTLEQIDKAIEGWQHEIMSAATDMLNSMPQIVAGKEKLARAKAAEVALQTLKEALGRDSFPAQKLELVKQIGKLAEISINDHKNNS
ncbi:MAG: hypothetical protein ACLPSF_03935 [Methylocella sp.]